MNVVEHAIAQQPPPLIEDRQVAFVSNKKTTPE